MPVARSGSASAGGGIYASQWPMIADGVIAALDFDFANGRYYQAGQVGNPLTLTTTSRASTAYADNAAGVWSAFLANVPRITDKGLLVEQTTTNVVLWNRDLTNAVWTKSNITVALDQVGIDGIATSASKLTATAGNGTVLQSITLASSARWQTAFVKRLTGTGVVNMTMDNGATWTVIAVTSAWTRVAIPAQTLANPTVGFRLVTSGDAIAVDFVQNENNALFATSPILVTTVAVARAADTVTVSTAPTFGTAYTLYVASLPISSIALAFAQALVEISDGTANNLARLQRAATSGAPGLTVVSGGVTRNTPGLGGWAQFAAGKLAGAVTNLDAAASFNGGAIMAPSPQSVLPVGVNAIRLGVRNTGSGAFSGYITRVIVWPSTRVSNTSLQGITV